MSTRAGIIVKDSYCAIHFYKHSDGYPDGTMPILNRFLDLIKAGKLREDAMQSAGWLIILGADEYQKDGFTNTLAQLESGKDLIKGYSWKVGSIEPTQDATKHGDLEYIYTIDVTTKTITVKEV